MRTCPSCHAVNEDVARFCENCGARLEEKPLADETKYYDRPLDDETQMYELRHCPACGMVNEMEAKFCAACGEALEDAAPVEEEPLVSGEQIRCQTCGFDNDKDALFCENCGARIERKDTAERANDKDHCPACGFINDDDAVFCESCGARLPSAGEKGAVHVQTLPKQMPLTPRKPLSKLQKIVAIEAAVLVVLVALFFIVGNNRYSAESVAETYFDAYVNGDWETVYSLLDLPAGNFLAKDQFEAVMEDTRLPDIESYSVHAASMGEPAPGEVTSTPFEAEYESKAGIKNTMDLTLVKKDEKTLFFFDTWRVDADAVADTISILVPKGADVALDGIALGEDCLTDSIYAGMDHYEVAVFNGDHTVNAALPWCEVAERELDSASNGSAMFLDFTFTEEGAQAMQAKMQTALETFYTSARSGADFDALEGLFASDASEDCEEEYQKLLDHLTDGNLTLNQIRFSEFEFDQHMSDGQFQGSLAFDCSYNYTSHGSSSDRTSDNDSRATLYATFTYEDGTYKITDIDVPVMP